MKWLKIVYKDIFSLKFLEALLNRCAHLVLVLELMFTIYFVYAAHAHYETGSLEWAGYLGAAAIVGWAFIGDLKEDVK